MDWYGFGWYMTIVSDTDFNETDTDYLNFTNTFTDIDRWPIPIISRYPYILLSWIPDTETNIKEILIIHRTNTDTNCVTKEVKIHRTHANIHLNVNSLQCIRLSIFKLGWTWVYLAMRGHNPSPYSCPSSIYRTNLVWRCRAK